MARYTSPAPTRTGFRAERIRAIHCYLLLPACYPTLSPLLPAATRPDAATRNCPIRCYRLLPAATRCSHWAQLGALHTDAWAHHQMQTTCNWHSSSCAIHTSGPRQSGLPAATRCYPLLPLLPAATRQSRWAQFGALHTAALHGRTMKRTQPAIGTLCHASCAMHTLGLRQSGLPAAIRCYPLQPLGPA